MCRIRHLLEFFRALGWNTCCLSFLIFWYRLVCHECNIREDRQIVSQIYLTGCRGLRLWRWVPLWLSSMLNELWSGLHCNECWIKSDLLKVWQVRYVQRPNCCAVSCTCISFWWAYLGFPGACATCEASWRYALHLVFVVQYFERCYNLHDGDIVTLHWCVLGFRLLLLSTSGTKIV